MLNFSDNLWNYLSFDKESEFLTVFTTQLNSHVFVVYSNFQFGNLDLWCIFVSVLPNLKIWMSYKLSTNSIDLDPCIAFRFLHEGFDMIFSVH